VKLLTRLHNPNFPFLVARCETFSACKEYRWSDDWVPSVGNK